MSDKTETKAQNPFQKLAEAQMAQVTAMWGEIEKLQSASLEHTKTALDETARLSKETQINTYNTGWGYGWGWGYGAGMGMTTSTVSEIPVGTLIIDLVDASKKQLAWRGTASKTLEPSASPETKDKNIHAAVQKMFANYPPGGAK